MKKFLSSTVHFVLSVIAAAAAAGYWYMTGNVTVETASEIFLGVFLAASPIPWLVSRWLIALRIKRHLRADGISCSRMSALTELMHVDTIAFNRNGTLTEGNIFISALVPEGMTQGSLLALAASAERDAVHPYAQALYRTALERGLHLTRHSAAREEESFGVEALIVRTPVRVGKKEWLQEENIEISAALLTRADQLATSGQSPLFVSSSKYARGIIAVRDDLRMEAKRALSDLRQHGFSLVLLTGETKRLANATGKELRIPDVRSDLTEMDKAREIRLLQSRGAIVAMAGDPIADQAALRTADISIGCPSTLVKVPNEPKEETEADPLHAELLKGPDGTEAAAEVVEPLIPPEDAAYFKAQTRRNQGKIENYVPDITLDSVGLPRLVTLIDAGEAARVRARQNTWLTALFIALFTPTAAGFLPLLDVPLPYPWVGGALILTLGLQAANALRK